MAESNNLENITWLNILFWVVTPIMLIGLLFTCLFLTGSGTALINRFVRRSVFGVIAKSLSWLSIFYFPTILIWVFVALYFKKSKSLFSF